MKSDSKYEVIKLENGVEVKILRKFEYSKCRACKQQIIWGKTKNKKNIPVYYSPNLKRWVCHFEDCPKANNFRKRE